MSETSPEFQPSIPPPERQFDEGNGQAVAGMVLGVLSFVSCGPFFSVPAVILGHLALNKIRRGRMSADAHGFAMAGLVPGYINLAFFLFAVVPFIFLAVHANSAGHVPPFTDKL